VSANLANLLGCTDEHGYLFVADQTPGAVTNAPQSIGAHVRAAAVANGALKVVLGNIVTTHGDTRTPIMELKLRTDENGSILCNLSEHGVDDGPLTLGMHVRSHTDENGRLMVSSRTKGALLSALQPIGMLHLRTDENGHLIVCS
jgi:hypothetical protein